MLIYCGKFSGKFVLIPKHEDIYSGTTSVKGRFLKSEFSQPERLVSTKTLRDNYTYVGQLDDERTPRIPRFSIGFPECLVALIFVIIALFILPILAKGLSNLFGGV